MKTTVGYSNQMSAAIGKCYCLNGESEDEAVRDFRNLMG